MEISRSKCTKDNFLKLNFAIEIMHENTMHTAESLRQKLQQLQVLVIGDLMLDRYLYGQVHRISPEAPVPVVHIESKEDRLGGAANVALNCAKLGAKVHLAGITGDDEAAESMFKLLAEQQIDASLVLSDEDRPTTIKTRVISRHQQLFRMDEEREHQLGVSIENQFIDKILKFIQIQKPDVVIFEDYDKGALNAHVVDKVMQHCQHLGCVTAVDPKFNTFHSYKGATIFKPNLKEVAEAFQLDFKKNALEVLELSAEKLQETLKPQVLLITLSELGIYLQEGAKRKILPANKRRIADVSGAGDTVVATASMVFAATKNALLTAQLANIAGGMVCEYSGVVPVNLEDWLQESAPIIEKNEWI